MQNPLFNITMPVFNRFLLTQKTILRLQKLKARTQCTLTVVDNGSEDALRERLIAFAKEGFIDKLFILPRNMGISFACNLGWKATPAPYFIKIDNDITITNPDFLLAIEGIYAIIEKNATLGTRTRNLWQELKVHSNPLWINRDLYIKPSSCCIDHPSFSCRNCWLFQ